MAEDPSTGGIRARQDRLAAAFARRASGDGGARAATTAGPSPAAQPADTAGTLLALFRSELAARRRLVMALVAAGAVSALVAFAVPLLTMAVFDRVIPHGALETLWALAIGVAILLAVDVRLRQARHDMGDALAIATHASLSARVFARLVAAPLASLPRSPGALLPPAQELKGATQVAPQFIAGCLVDIPFFLLATALIAALGGWLGLVPVAGAALLAGIHLAGYAASDRALAADTGHAHRQTQMIIHAVSGAETIRTTGSGPNLIGQWTEETDAAAMSGHRLRATQAMVTNGAQAVLQAVTVATLIGGAYAISASAMSVGALSACLMLAGRAVMPVSTLMLQAFRLKQAARAMGPLADLARQPAEAGRDATATGASLPIDGGVTLSGVRFAYAGAAQPALDGVSLRIAPGERVALIGRSGCGKSTLLRLVARLHEPTEGRIHVDGRDIRQIDPARLRRDIMLMTQESQLFDATLEANLCAGLADVPPERLRHVARIAGVADFAERKAEGYALDVGPGGQRLSGGERQSVALARALMGRPKLLLLDEPTSAMDNERETRVVNALRHEFARGDGGGLSGTGLVVATHRLALLALVDRVICLDAGRIVADGPKEQVLRQLDAA